MKFKLLFGLMFVMGAFSLQAQYVGPTQAIQILDDAVANFENGTYDVKDLYTGNTSQADQANGPISGNYNFDATALNQIFPGIMMLTAKEIEAANDTAQGILNAEAKLDTAGDSNREAAVDAVFTYIRSLVD